MKFINRDNEPGDQTKHKDVEWAVCGWGNADNKRSNSIWQSPFTNSNGTDLASEDSDLQLNLNYHYLDATQNYIMRVVALKYFKPTSYPINNDV